MFLSREEKENREKVNCFYFNVLEAVKTTETETETAENIKSRRVADTPVTVHETDRSETVLR